MLEVGGQQDLVGYNIKMSATIQQPQANRCKMKTSSLGHWGEGQQQKVGMMVRGRGCGKGSKRGGITKSKE